MSALSQPHRALRDAKILPNAPLSSLLERRRPNKGCPKLSSPCLMISSLLKVRYSHQIPYHPSSPLYSTALADHLQSNLPLQHVPSCRHPTSSSNLPHNPPHTPPLPPADLRGPRCGPCPPTVHRNIFSGQVFSIKLILLP